MKKFLILLLLVAGFCSCSDEDKSSPILVTEVVMPSGTAAPGAEVTIQAKGFEAADDIFVRMGQSILRADVVGVESTSIRFFVPGGLPAGTADILLMRSGKYMVLGSMSLADGLPPKEVSLYGVGLNLAGETIISRIDLESGAVTQVAALGEDLPLTNIVNSPGSNTIYGISGASGQRKPVWYNLTTKRYGELDRTAITMGVIGSQPTSLYQLRPGVVSLSSAGFTRSNASIKEPGPIGWELPGNITSEMLTVHSFLSVSNFVFLSARLSAGNFMPVAMEIQGNLRMIPSDPVEADGLIPFRFVKSSNKELFGVGGYAVVKQNETVFRLFNPNTLSLDEEVFRVPAAVVSYANVVDGVKTARAYLLCRSQTGMKVYTYDLTVEDPQMAFKPLTGEVYFSEIVLVR